MPLFPPGLGPVILLAVGLLVNNLAPGAALSGGVVVTLHPPSPQPSLGRGLYASGESMTGPGGWQMVPDRDWARGLGVDLTDDDCYEAMRAIPGYLDISLEDFREVYRLALAHAAGRLTGGLTAGDLMEPVTLTLSARPAPGPGRPVAGGDRASRVHPSWMAPGVRWGCSRRPMSWGTLGWRPGLASWCSTSTGTWVWTCAAVGPWWGI